MQYTYKCSKKTNITSLLTDYISVRPVLFSDFT